MKSWKRPKQNQFLSKIWQVLAAILQLISATKVIVTKRCSIKKNTRWHMYSLEIKSLLQRAMLIRLPYVTASAWCLPVFMCVCAWKSFCLHLWYCAWRNWNSSLILSQESEVVNFSCCDEACQREKHKRRKHKNQVERERVRKMRRGEQQRKGAEWET